MKFKNSYIWAGLVALGVIGWMVSGSFTGSDEAGTAAVSDGSGQDMTTSAGQTQTSPEQTANAAPRVSAVIVESSDSSSSSPMVSTPGARSMGWMQNDGHGLEVGA